MKKVINYSPVMTVLRVTIRLFSFSLLLGVLLVFASSCEKDEEIINKDITYGTVTLLYAGGGNPSWSPNGEKIAYLVDGEKLYVMNSDGSDNLLLSSQIYENFKWSPSGMELAYDDYRGGPLALYKIGVDGNNEVKLTGAGLSIMSSGFSWSPDGEEIAYSVDGFDKVDLYIMNNDGSGNHKVGIPISVSFPIFTPSGSRIMFSSLVDGNTKRALFLVGTDGSSLQRLEIPDVIDVRNAVMKGDESKIYFSSYKAGSDWDWDIYEVNSDGTNLKNLTNGMGNNKEPHISPDGKHIVFLSYRDDIDGVWIMHADGSNPARISKRDYLFYPGSWSPDSRKLVFHDEVNGVEGIYVLTLK